jgi:hypothetical protein
VGRYGKQRAKQVPTSVNVHRITSHIGPGRRQVVEHTSRDFLNAPDTFRSRGASRGHVELLSATLVVVNAARQDDSLQLSDILRSLALKQDNSPGMLSNVPERRS